MGESFSFIQLLCIWALPVLFAITVHEVAHGWVARYRGDPTAFMLGRLTLNPLKHIDLIGTIIVPLLLLSLGGFIFGWAKPVPINTRHFKQPRFDMALVAIAGPLANFIMLFLWIAVVKASGYLMTSPGLSSFALPMHLMGMAGVQINLLLGILNLFPIPPLDGARVFSAFLSARLGYWYNHLEPYGFFLLVLLIATGLFEHLLTPPFVMAYGWLHQIFGLLI